MFTSGLGGAGVIGPSGVASDDIQMLTVAGVDSEPVCEGAGNGVPAEVSLYRQGFVVDPPPAPPNGPLMFLVLSEIVPSTTTAPATQDDRWVARRLTGLEERATPDPSVTWELCSGAGASMHTVLHFADTDTFNPSTLCANANQSPAGNYPAGAPCANYRITRAVFGRQVTYQIRPDADGVPVLQRISTEDPMLTPQVIARGIEELQVQYTQFEDPADWVDDAPTVAEPTVDSLDLATTQDRFVTMSTILDP